MELGQLANGAVDLIGPGLVVVVEEGEVDFFRGAVVEAVDSAGRRERLPQPGQMRFLVR